MNEVSKSFRVDAALSDELTRRAEANGQSFSAYVIGILTRSIEEPKAAEGANLDGVIGSLRREIASLRETLRAERLTQSEVVESILGLTRVAKEFESERQKTVEVLSRSTVEMDRVKGELKQMAEVGGLASKSVKESSSALVKALAETNTASLAALEATEKNLRQMEVTAEKVKQIAAHQRDTFASTTREFTREVKENAREFLSDYGRKWRLVLASVLVILIAGAGASGFWIFVNQSKEVARAEQQAQTEAEKRNSYQQGSNYLLQEICEGRRPKVARRYCMAPGESINENPYR